MRLKHLTLLVLSLSLLISDGLRAQTEIFLRLAFMPLNNYTGEQKAYDLAHEHILNAIIESGIDVVETDLLRPTLRKHRIRSTNSISGQIGQIIAQASNTDLLLVGSVAFYDNVGYPQFGLSLRLVRPMNMEIVSAASGSATGRDYVGLFARGAVGTADSLASLLAREVIGELVGSIRYSTEADLEAEAGGTVIVLPFENISRDRYAGLIAADWLVTELYSSGYDVVEPGVVADLLLNMGGVPTGEIDRPQMDKLRAAFGVSTIITGQVDTFRPARGVSLHSRPALSLGVRFIDANSGNVDAMFETEQNGGDYSTIFGGGTCLSLGTLLEYALNKAISESKIRTLQHAIR